MSPQHLHTSSWGSTKEQPWLGFFSHFIYKTVVGLPVLIQWRGSSSYLLLYPTLSLSLLSHLLIFTSPWFKSLRSYFSLLDFPVFSLTLHLILCSHLYLFPYRGKETHAHTQRQMTDVCHCKRSHSGSGAVLKMCEKGEFSVSPKCELAAWKTWSILFYCELLKTASYCIWDWKGLEAPACRRAAGTQLYNSYSQLLRSHPAYCYVPKALRPPPQTKHIST